MRRREVKFPILGKNTTSVWPCIRGGVVEQEICFLQNLNFRNCSAALNLMSECVI